MSSGLCNTILIHNACYHQDIPDMAKTVQSEKELLDIIRDVVVARLHPERIFLFGSRASGTDKAYSDFDIAVEGGDGSFREMRKLKGTLDEVLGIYSCDVVRLEKTSIDFQDLIKSQGKLLYERD